MKNSIRGHNKDIKFYGYVTACTNGDLEEVKRLLKDNELRLTSQEFGIRKDRGFYAACESGHVDVVQYLITTDLSLNGHDQVDLHGDEEYAFRLACESGRLNVVKYLLTSPEIQKAGHARIHLHALNEYGLRFACKKNHWDVAKYLLSSIDVVNAGHDWPDVTAIKNQVLKIAMIAISHKEGAEDFLRWLVFDFKIPWNEEVKKDFEEQYWSNHKGYGQGLEWFQIRQEREMLIQTIQPEKENKLISEKKTKNLDQIKLSVRKTLKL